MKLSNKVALGVALVALLGGGLAGCGKQKSAPRSSNAQQSPERPQSDNANQSSQTAGAMNGLVNDPPKGKTKSFWTTEPSVPYTFVYKKPDTVKKQEKRFNPNNDLYTVVHTRYNPTSEIKHDWQSIHQQIAKNGLDSSAPLKIQFLYYTDTVDGRDNRLYRVFTANTDSSSLHDSHMKLLKKFSQEQSFDPNSLK